MRILSVGNMYPPHRLGGYEVIWEDWVERARSAGHEVEVLTTDFRADGVTTSEAEHGVYRELRWYWHDHEFPKYSIRKTREIEEHNAGVIGRRLDALKPQAVVWWGMAGMSTGLYERVRRSGLPSVAVLGDYWLEYAKNVDGWMRRFERAPGLGWLAERLTGVISTVDFGSGLEPVFVSDTVRQAAASVFPQYRERDVIHHGPDLSLFRPTPEHEWKWKLLYAGRIDKRKGVDLAVRALAQLPDASLTVIGSGDDEHLDELRTLSSKLELRDRVQFRAQVPREALPAEFAAADALVFPVLWGEPWGLVPSEAMAAGLPVIATGRGGSGEYLVDDSNCLIFDPDQGPGGLADCVSRLAADPRLRARLRDEGYRTASKLGETDFSARILDVVLAVASKNPDLGSGRV